MFAARPRKYRSGRTAKCRRHSVPGELSTSPRKSLSQRCRKRRPESLHATNSNFDFGGTVPASVFVNVSSNLITRGRKIVREETCGLVPLTRLNAKPKKSSKRVTRRFPLGIYWTHWIVNFSRARAYITHTSYRSREFVYRIFRAKL